MLYIIGLRNQIMPECDCILCVTAGICCWWMGAALLFHYRISSSVFREISANFDWMV